MKKIKAVLILIILLFTSILTNAQTSIVERYGQLSIKGNYVIGQYGDTVQLRGMSLFWSQWMPQYYTPETVKWLKEDWKCTVVRAAMGVEFNGYGEKPEQEKEKVVSVVDAAIRQGIYVIIDYHTHEAHKYPEKAKEFFGEMAKKYGKYPNVLYEIYNEPLQEISWANDIKPYSESMVQTIRKHDPDNIIICGTRQWSQLVDEAAQDPVKGGNIAYTLHFYAASHGYWLVEEARKAMKTGIAIFVTEFGTCEYTGDGKVDEQRTKAWFDFMDQYKISWCNWSITDKVESCAALKPGASGSGNWKAEEITPSGTFIREELRSKNTPLFVAKPKKQ